jgi:hypothetical protein
MPARCLVGRRLLQDSTCSIQSLLKLQRIERANSLAGGNSHADRHSGENGNGTDYAFAISHSPDETADHDETTQGTVRWDARAR